MSDVAEVKEALEFFERKKMLRDLGDVEVVVDAARRWVRLVEGLDYEEATRFVREVLEIPASWFTTGDIHQTVNAAVGAGGCEVVDLYADSPTEPPFEAFVEKVRRKGAVDDADYPATGCRGREGDAVRTKLYRRVGLRGSEFEQVSTDQLVAALQEEGGQVVEARKFGGQGVIIEAVSDPGRYLVVRIDGEET